jgi:hypothetical protein
MSRFQKGHIPWTSGNPLPEETRRKISMANTGKHPSEETIEKMRLRMTGTRLSEETKKKIRAALLGHKMSESNKLILSKRMKSIPFEKRSLAAKLASQTKKKNGIIGGVFQNNHKHSQETIKKLKKAMLGKRGPKSPSWKGGITPKNRLARTGIEFTTWRGLVFGRDNFKCIKCGNGGFLHPHHIYNFSDHQDIRFNPNNGITLCVSCHKDFHKKYGRTKNNQTQIDEWRFLK